MPHSLRQITRNGKIIMSLYFRKAETTEFDAVRKFYYDLIDKMRDFKYRPKWQKGIYPADGYLKTAIENGELYLTLNGSTPVGAMVFNTQANDGYDGARWSVNAGKGEFAVLHLLAVSPDFARQGIGTFLVKNAISLAKQMHLKAIRLDVLEGNLPAERLYCSTGFSHVQTLQLFYEDTGLCNFDLFEYDLTK